MDKTYQNSDVILERYQVIQTIGSGGMGEVYKVEDIKDHSIWAAKVMQADGNNINEARLLKKLQCSYFPEFRESMQEENVLYLVMEYIPGKSLKDMIQEQSGFTETDIRKCYRQLCEVLIYLHGLNPPVAYRDFKPENILITGEGDVRLIDFGISEEYSPEHTWELKYTALTRGYAAPEQYSSKYYVDVRTDIYALGSTMHYLLTGKNPQKPPYKFAPVRKLNRTISPELEAVVQRSLQPNPEKRYQSAEELYWDLTHMEELGEKLRRQNKRKRIRLVLMVSALGAAAVLSYGITFQVQKNQQNEFEKIMQTADEKRQLGDYQEAESCLKEAMVLEPDTVDSYLAMAELYYEEEKLELCRQYLTYTVIPRFVDVIQNPRYQKLDQLLVEKGVK